VTAPSSPDSADGAPENDATPARSSSSEAILRVFLLLVEDGRAKRPTFAEIAEEAGVGVRTVHRYAVGAPLATSSATTS
jgi:hypothetical protein